ncbi:ankyrin repeat-containing domain protein [Pseudomassariella vexata]|uniref:Ankyrin repeat-containing domain protein n=1 Tax=Pseudomassariella vexata TaxID=1141098 RepID=A0A1Y2EF95_9PEZI|nr:ankyrin repeat-containing domain protein [Pseudomassariella vexata]ORY70251.1 ankyrin repeat-containing domain protein [Pseudomassariella vexata]
MEAATVIDLAAACAELVGSTGASAITINRLVRTYPDAPSELKQLQAHLASGRSTLDRLLSLLDRDTPVFQHQADIEALGAFFSSISVVVRDIQEHVSSFDGQSGAWDGVQHIWMQQEIAETGGRLGKQVDALEVYLRAAKHQTATQEPAQITREDDRACLEVARHVASTAANTPATSATGADTPETTPPPQMVPSLQSGPPTDSSHPSVALSNSVSRLNIAQFIDKSKRQSMFGIPSARKVKSLMLLQKSISPIQTHDLAIQGDEVCPAEFKTRVTGYTTGITPSWELISVPYKKKTKQVYRNRFTRSPADDVAPSKLQSHFKVEDKHVFEAIIHKQVEKVHQVMDHRWSNNPVVERHDRSTALHVAASLGLYSIVQIIVSLGANPNCEDRFGATPLHYAADLGCASCVHILVSAGAKVNKSNLKAKIKTPLWYAADRGNPEAVDALLNLGAHIYTQAPNPCDTILYAAAKSGSVKTCQAILDAGANPNESFDLLSVAATTSKDVLNCLRNAGADIDACDNEQRTLLHKYSLLGDVSMVEFLLSLGGNPSPSDESGNTPLHLALHKGGFAQSITIATFLVDRRANLNVRNKLGQTPLHLAALWGRFDIANLLCQAWANMDIPDGNGVSPFAETQKSDYKTRPVTNSLMDYNKLAEIMRIWHETPPETRRAKADAIRPSASELAGGEVLANVPAAELGPPNLGKGLAVAARELDSVARLSAIYEMPT